LNTKHETSESGSSREKFSTIRSKKSICKTNFKEEISAVFPAESHYNAEKMVRIIECLKECNKIKHLQITVYQVLKICISDPGGVEYLILV